MKDEIAAIARKAIETEITGLKSIMDNSIDERFFELVNAILNSKGKIILSAVGKPAYIAHKVAAGLTSTGTPAVYIHATEASHGDLGIIEKEDIVILLSTSGGSVELNDIIAYCKRYNIRLVGITRTKSSFLYESSDLPILLENVPETNPVNSPTTSSLMFLGYLDMMLTVLIHLKSFNNDNFKVFHPGGKLGSSLIKVDDIMTTGTKIPLVHINQTMENVIDEMTLKNLGCVGILEKDTNKLVGIVTDGDLKRAIKQYKNILDVSIDDIMTKNPVVMNKGELAINALKLMDGPRKYIQVLFIVDNNVGANETNVAGILHIQDLFKAKVI